MLAMKRKWHFQKWKFTQNNIETMLVEFRRLAVKNRTCFLCSAFTIHDSFVLKQWQMMNMAMAVNVSITDVTLFQVSTSDRALFNFEAN